MKIVSVNMRIFIVILFFLLFSCSPYRFKKRQFVFEGSNGNMTLDLRVPARYAREEIKYESSGNKEQLYYYPNGAFLYVSRLNKAINSNQQIDRDSNIPLDLPKCGLVFKGVLPGPLFWREITLDSFRIGYKNVPRASEFVFDSATNFASKLRFLR